MDNLHMMHSFINDFWQFIKGNYVAPDRDDYWDAVAKEIDAIASKYNRHPAVVKTLMGYMDYLEHEGCGRER